MFKDRATFGSFSVDDISAAKQFYGETLGLDVRETPMGLDVHLAGGARTFIYPKPDHQPASFTLLNFLVSSVESAVQELTRAGVDIEHYDTDSLTTDERGISSADGITIAWFRDPAGNYLSVVEDIEQ